MNTWFIVTASLTLVLISVMDCKPTPFETKEVHACGKDLADILQRVCQGRYNFHHAEESNESTNDVGRKKRGIVQECCHWPCTYYDLVGYCQNSSFLTNELRMDSTTKNVPRSENSENDREHQKPINELIPGNEINFNNDENILCRPTEYDFATTEKITQITKKPIVNDGRTRKGLDVIMKEPYYQNKTLIIETRIQRAQ